MVLIVVLGACSGSPSSAPGEPDAAVEVCVDPADTELPDGLFARPADFDRADCVAGAFAGIDVAGFWYMESPNQNKFSSGPVRIESSCSDGMSVAVSNIASATQMPIVYADDDDLFFRRERQFDEWSLVDAFDLCAVDAEGRPTGRAVRCFVHPQFGEDCSERTITLSPFGRIPGESESDGMSLVAAYGGPPGAPWPEAFTANVAVHGDTAFVARGEDAVRIVDVSDPAAPREIASVPAESDNFNDLAVVPTADKVYLLVASAALGVIVVDVTDPSAPVDVLRFQIQKGAGVHRLWVDHVGEEYRAYLADGNGQTVGIWNVTDPAAPQEIGTYSTGDDNWGVHALFARGDDVYLNATGGGLLALELDPPGGAAVAHQVGRYAGPENVFSHASMPVTTTAGARIVVHGQEGYDSPIEILDDDPASETYMELIGDLVLRKQVSIHNFVAVGDTLYVAHYQDGVRVVDLSQPTAPRQLAYYNTWDPATAPGGLLEGAVDLEVRGDLVFVADTPRGLVILRRD